MWAVVLVAVALAVVYCTQWVLRWRNPKCNGVLPPGSMGLPLIGETLQIAAPSYSWDMHPFVKTRVAKSVEHVRTVPYSNFRQLINLRLI